MVMCREGKVCGDFDMIVGGVADLHCRSDRYLAGEVWREYKGLDVRIS